MYKDKVVVITGGSQGIGQHLALAYLEQQAKVIVLDIAPNKNPDMDFHLVDLGRPEQIEQAFDEIQGKYGKVDVLINNGAIANFNKPIQQLTFEEFSRVIDVNLKGAFACSRRFIALNHTQPYGRIINIASTRWNQNESGWDAYGASKGGVVSMTQSMAISLSDTPITVNAVSPGWIQVEGYGELDSFDHQQHPSVESGKQKILLMRVFFTHPENDFVNGHNLVVDGGMSKK
ncbi:LOW QUALITY PROTEIN: oxidoreductase [Vibrio sp. JCM 19052]|nr:LOW QUALITY PROTEIN: oxidoreductase [Vibrio sp. JCM 19052]